MFRYVMHWLHDLCDGLAVRCAIFESESFSVCELSNYKFATVQQVTIVSTIVQRRAEVSVTGGVLVNAQIAAKDMDDAHSLRTSLNNDVLNNQLENQGLPSGTLLSIKIQVCVHYRSILVAHGIYKACAL